MHVDVYEQLADALNALPNGYPRTPSKVEIKILKKIFSFEEAEIASQLTGSMEPVDTIAERIGLEVSEARGKLMAMVKRGLVWFSKKGGKPYFRLAPFIVGIFEAQVKTMDAEFARLFEQYFMASGGRRALPTFNPPFCAWCLPRKRLKPSGLCPTTISRPCFRRRRYFTLMTAFAANSRI